MAHRMIRLALLGLTLTLAARSASAQTSDSPLLHGLARALADPQTQMGFLPNSSVLGISSPHGDFSLGQDGRLRAHNPGTLMRVDRLAGSGALCAGACLGHHGRGAPDSPDFVARVLVSPYRFTLRRDELGFVGRHYSPKTRPLDLSAGNLRVTVHPDGRTVTRVLHQGPMGFALPGLTGQRRPTTGGAAQPSGAQPVDAVSGTLLPPPQRHRYSAVRAVLRKLRRGGQHHGRRH